MLEYEMMDDDRYHYEKYESNLEFKAEMKLMLMRYTLEKLDKEQVLGHKPLPEGYENRFLEASTVDELAFMLDLLERYPELSDKKLARKYILEGEYSPWG